MHDKHPESNGAGPDRLAAETAALWLARQDRGLSTDETREFERWIADDRRHAAEFARLSAAWLDLECAKTMSQFAEAARRLDESTRRRPFNFRRLRVGAAAAAAALLCWFAAERRPIASPPAAPPARMTYQLVPSEGRRTILADGSVVHARDGARVEVEYTAAERRIRLVHGEAHFNVSHDPARPFIVSAGRITVRAVGTIFDVRMDSSAIRVVVTNGKVRIGDAVNGAALAKFAPREQAASPPDPGSGLLTAGHCATIPVETDSGSPGEPRVDAITPFEVEQALAWQDARFVFNRTTLEDAARAFNLHCPRKLAIGDPSLNGKLLGGTFRADNVDGFVRVLEEGANVRAERRGDGSIILWPDR